MLFNSFEFIFVFLPVVVGVFFALSSRAPRRLAIAWLVAASLFFYGWWDYAFVALILFSILFNYALGLSLGRGERSIGARWALGFSELRLVPLNPPRRIETSALALSCYLLDTRLVPRCAD